MNVASFQESTIDLTSKVWVRNLGTILGRCQAPKATVGSFFGQYPSPSDNGDPGPPKKLYIYIYIYIVNWAWFTATILG